MITNSLQMLQRIRRLSWLQRIRLLRRLATDRRTPHSAKALIPALVAYLVFPIDIIPDFIPVLGHLDDVIVLLAGVWLLVRLIPPQVLEDHMRALEGKAA